MPLTSSQAAALAHIEQYALARKEAATAVMEEVCAMSAIARELLEEVIYLIQTQARVALHFHPDRLDQHHTSVAEALLSCGLYKNQFETGLSNGKLSPLRGSSRDSWEQKLFGDAYASSEIAVEERPRYGALDLMRHPDGPAPRFGSCYFLLKPRLTQRSTFTYLDSHRNPAERGTINVFEDLMAALLLECFERQYALGEKDITPARLMNYLHNSLSKPYPDLANRAPARNLDHYIEAQLHGKVTLENDVEMLVADPSFQEKPTGETLRQLCQKWGIALRWHGGFRLALADVPGDFRGNQMPSLAARVAPKGLLTAARIGEAAAELKRYPQRWQDRGSYEHCLQELKLLWHVLLRFGESSPTASPKSNPYANNRYQPGRIS